MYEAAIDSASSPAEAAWAIYQAANCQRQADPGKALALYRRLIAEHPNCLWIRTAGIQVKLLDWRRINKPQDVLQRAQAILDSATQPKPAPATVGKHAKAGPSGQTPKTGKENG